MECTCRFAQGSSRRCSDRTLSPTAQCVPWCYCRDKTCRRWRAEYRSTSCRSKRDIGPRELVLIVWTGERRRYFEVGWINHCTAPTRKPCRPLPTGTCLPPEVAEDSCRRRTAQWRRLQAQIARRVRSLACLPIVIPHPAEPGEAIARHWLAALTAKQLVLLQP